MNYELQNL